MLRKIASSIAAVVAFLGITAVAVSQINSTPATQPAAAAPAKGSQLNLRLRLLDSDPALAPSGKRPKILASPTLLALPNQTASFLAGGEFPIAGPDGKFREYAEFGTRFIAKFDWAADNKVWLDLKVEKIDQDTTHGIATLHTDSLHVVGNFPVGKPIALGQLHNTDGKPIWAELTATILSH